MISFRCESVDATHALAGRLALGLLGAFRQGVVDRVVVGLVGGLGAGKTELIRGFVAGIDPALAREVTSPTYAILQQYPSEPPVRHLDLYRLGSLDDLEAIGYREAYYEPGIVLVEWIDHIPEGIPGEWIEIALAVLPSDVREISLRAHGERTARLLGAIFT